MPEGWALALSVLLAGTGVSHLLAPSAYEGIVPRSLPGPRLGWTVASGIAELACAGLVANRRTRRAGATLATGLFVVVFPGNVQMALDWSHRPGLYPLLAYARLPLQVPLIVWAWRVRRAAPDRRFGRASRRSTEQTNCCR